MISDLLSSWSVRVGLALILPIVLFVPWRQELLWNRGNDVVVPLKIVRYEFIWNPPLEASVDLVRLFTELVLLAVIVAVAYHFERARRSSPR